MLNFKIATVQFNATVGALEHNLARLFDAYLSAAKLGADLIVAPEFCLTGYPLEDLVLRESFLKAVENEKENLINYVLASGFKAAFIFGTPVVIDNRFIHNAAYFVDPENFCFWPCYKHELPNYGVFDEKRTFKYGPILNPIAWRGIKIGLMICEDAWKPRVSSKLAECGGGADLLISINGSPFEMGKVVTRHKIIQRRIAETGLPFLYVNAVGGQDELVFDGGSFFYNRFGTVFESPRFKESIDIFDVEIKNVGHLKNVNEKNPGLTDQIHLYLDTNCNADQYIPITQPDVIEETYQALVLGLRDYLRKQNFKSVVLGYSGGVDSGLVAAIACDAIGPDNVHLVRLPSKFSSESSLDDAADGAKRLNAPMRTIDIENTVDAFRGAYKTAWTGNTHPAFAKPSEKLFYWHNKPLTGTADENLQARARGTILMAISNQEGHILLSTGNKSEVSVGYSTIYGDSCGGYNPLKDVYKTTVWKLCRWRNAVTDPEQYNFHGPAGIVVPESIISKQPSAELRENQQDSDSLPPYDVLDFILQNMIENEKGVEEIIDLMTDSPYVGYVNDVLRIRKLVDQSEYKRRQAAPGIKVTGKIHGRDRRYPVVNHWRK